MRRHHVSGGGACGDEEGGQGGGHVSAGVPAGREGREVRRREVCVGGTKMHVSIAKLSIVTKLQVGGPCTALPCSLVTLQSPAHLWPPSRAWPYPLPPTCTSPALPIPRTKPLPLPYAPSPFCLYLTLAPFPLSPHPSP